MGSRSRRRKASKVAEERSSQNKVLRALSSRLEPKQAPPKTPSWLREYNDPARTRIGGDRAPKVRLTRAERSANIKVRRSRPHRLKSNATSMGNLDHAHKLLSGVTAEWSTQ